MSKFHRGHTQAAKLKTEDVVEIRRLYAEEGWTQGMLSKRYQVGVGQIGRIVRGEAWQESFTPSEEQVKTEAQLAELRLKRRMLVDMDDLPPTSSDLTTEQEIRLTRELGGETKEEPNPLDEMFKRRAERAKKEEDVK